MSENRSSEPGFLLAYPGVVGVLFALGVVAAFLGALYATSELHEAQPAAPAASAAPSAK